MLRGLSWFAGGRTGRGRRRRRPPGRDRDPHPRRWGVRELYAERCGGTWRTGTRCWPAGTPGCVALLVPVAAARPGAGARIGGRPRCRARSRNPAAAAPSIVDHAGRAIARDTGLDDRELVINRLGDAHRLRLTPSPPCARPSPVPPPAGPHPGPDRPPRLATHRSADGPRRRRRNPRPHPGADHPRGQRAAGDGGRRLSRRPRLLPDVPSYPSAAAVHSPTPRHRRHRQ